MSVRGTLLKFFKNSKWSMSLVVKRKIRASANKI